MILLIEVDIYNDEDTIVETIGQRIRRIIDHEKILKFAYMLKVPAGYLLTGEKNYKTNRMILTTIEDCVYSCELIESQMQIAQDLMHVFIKENELKEKTKKLLDKSGGEE